MEEDGDGPVDEAGPQLQFPTLDAFVQDLIAVVYELPTEASAVRTWCPEWWMHDAAVFRLTALWQAWEQMHVSDGPEGAARWLVSYGDPIMERLTAADGPFQGCGTVRGHSPHRPHEGGRLPCEPPPEGLLDPRG